MTEETQGDLLTADNQTETAQEWRNGVSEEFREGVSRFNMPGDLAKGYVELEKSLGNRVKIPTPESTAEETSAFYERIGRPSNAEGYEIDVPEGMERDEGFENAMRGGAFEGGVSQEQMSYLSKAYNDYKRAETERTRAEGETEMKGEWAAKYDVNLEIAKRACKEMGGDEVAKLLVKSNLGNHPVFLRMFHKIGTKMASDSLIRGGVAEEGGEAYTPQYPKSFAMYKNDQTPEGAKARAWFKERGITE